MVLKIGSSPVKRGEEVTGYLDKRDLEIDRSEWLDILYGIKAVVGNPRGMKIVELCAGKGYLIDFLRRHFPDNEYIGVDLEGCRYSNDVVCMNLEKELPPKGDLYVFQHCIEHIDQERVVELLRYSLRQGVAVIGIAPGHYSDDPTHKINHYEYNDLLKIIGKIKPRYYYIRPDLSSYVYPTSRDWLIILSNKPFNHRKTYPLIYGVSVFISRKLLRMYEMLRKV